MGEAMKIILLIMAIGFISAILAVFLRDSKMPVLGMMIGLVAGIIIFLQVLPSFVQIFSTITKITDQAGLETDYLVLIFKVVGIAYLGEFAAQLCRDADQGGIAQKIEMGIKIMIMLMALPLFEAILEAVVNLLS